MPYYSPPNIFRQSAVKARKENTPNTPKLDTRRSSWQNDTTRLNSPLLRQVSGDMNDYYTTKQLRSEFWTLPHHEADASSFLTSLSSSDSVILTSSMAPTDNLQIFSLNVNDKETAQLAELQTISVPGALITTSCLVPRTIVNSKQPDTHNRLLCSGHQDGVLNLISTSETEGGAKVIKRFNHAKFLKSTRTESLDALLQSRRASPIRKVDSWNNKGFISIVNESLFIYDFNQHRLPLYLQSFTGLEGVQANTENPNLLSLVGSCFGASGLSLLDLRCAGGHGTLYSPDTSENNDHNVSSASCWLNDYTVANTVGDCVKVWDIRSSGTKCIVRGHKGSVKSLKYHRESQRLFTSDDQNYTLAWDMQDLTNVSECHLATGFQSICEENVSQIRQCGNVVSGPNTASSQTLQSGVCGYTLLDTYQDGSLLTLNSSELGLHTVKDVKKSLVPLRNPLRIQATTEDTNVESDSTMNQDSIVSTWENTSDGTIEGDEFNTPVKNGPLSPLLIQEHKHKVLNPSIYSLKEFELSGSTIYNENIIHEEILL
ncbi:LAME_0H15896g1_1 [Lachancea meyersii CBS 8951]|uniref:LAME_0H15896g1_1 n=1 Tax=Lachancea meyersii CBS 8951 TaxID=1266667 RepID=A0A1G4KHZ7_9SACH|nr:LAME_0H15896g1_1 [Lachancea meyersii CBS 8951]